MNKSGSLERNEYTVVTRKALGVSPRHKEKARLF